LLAAIGLAVLGALASGIGRLPILLVGVGVGVAVLQASFDVGLTLARARQRTLIFGAASLARALLFLLLGFLAAHFVGTGVGVLAAVGIAYIVGNIILAPQWRSASRASSTVIKKYWSFGWPATVAAGLLYACTAAERYIVNGYLGTASVGLYGAVFDVTSQLVLAGSIAVGLASFPILVAANANEGPEGVRKRWRDVSLILGLVSTLAGTAIISFGPELAIIMVGPEFRPVMAKVLVYVVLAAMLNGFKSYALDPALHITKSTRTLMWIAATMFAVNVVAAAVLVPVIGLRGAGLAAVITFGTGAILTWYRVRRTGLLSFPTAALFGFLVAGFASSAISTRMPSGWRVSTISAKVAVIVTCFGIVGFVVWLYSRRRGNAMSRSGE